MVYENKRPDVAVFIDFENVYVSVRDKLDATPNFESIMDRCDDLGRVVIARAYADWYRYPRITSALYANGIEPMYVPTYYYDKEMGRTGRAIKNSVDMNLCIDAMKTLFTNLNIDKFVLATGDRDFIPLVNSIRQQGKEVIIIGIGGAASTHLAQSADEFIFYEQLIGKSTTPPVAANGRQRGRDQPVRSGGSGSSSEEHKPSEAVPAAEPDIYDVLVDAVHLVRKRGYVSTLGSLKLVMKELMGGDFKESRYRDTNGRPFAKFKDFVIDAERRGKVMIFTSGTVNEVFLPGEDPQKLSQFAADFKEETAEVCIEPEVAPAVSANRLADESAADTVARSSSTSRRRRRRSRKSADGDVKDTLDTADQEEPVDEAEAATVYEVTDRLADIVGDLAAEVVETSDYSPDTSLLDLAALSEAARALFADIAAEQTMANERMAATAELFFNQARSDALDAMDLPDLMAIDETMLFNIAETLALAADSEFIAAPLMFDSLPDEAYADQSAEAVESAFSAEIGDPGEPPLAEGFPTDELDQFDQPEYSGEQTDVAEWSGETGSPEPTWTADAAPDQPEYSGEQTDVAEWSGETGSPEPTWTADAAPDQPEYSGEQTDGTEWSGETGPPETTWPADAAPDQPEHSSEQTDGTEWSGETGSPETTWPADAATSEDDEGGQEEIDAEEPSEEEVHIVFSDEEWQAFQHMMADFTKPVSFANIFDGLRELRKQETLTRTNEHLRTMVKHAISNGMLERTGRGKRVYYKLRQSGQEQEPVSPSENQD